MNETVEERFVVKFDLGYYAKKQPNYEWSYTDDIKLAQMFVSHAAAKKRGDHGVGLCPMPHRIDPKTYEIETWVVNTTYTKTP